MIRDRGILIACAAVGLLPAGGVVGARFVGTGVRPAAAAEPVQLPPVPALPPEPEAGPSSAELAALPSPFAAADGPTQTVRRPAERTAQPTQAEAPEFSVSTVMPHPVRPLAVINGRPRTVGDEVEPGWTLTAIDGAARRVTLTGPGGRTVVVGMGQP